MGRGRGIKGPCRPVRCGGTSAILANVVFWPHGRLASFCFCEHAVFLHNFEPGVPLGVVQIRVWDIRRSGCMRILDQYCTSALAARQQQQQAGTGGAILEGSLRGSSAGAGLRHHSAAASALLASAMGCGGAPSSSSTASEARRSDQAGRHKRGRGEDALTVTVPEEADLQPAVPQGRWPPSGGL